MAATSIRGGEWLVGPAAAVKYSSDIFLIATIAIALQVVFNLEAVRYTLYTGEPIYGGIMRLKPGPRFWAGFYTVFGFLQLGWPALAGSAAATLMGAWMGRMAGAPEQATQGWIAVALILACVLILSFGGTIERMLEYFAWTMLGVVFVFLLFINIVFVPLPHWWATFRGFFSFSGMPQPIDWGLIGALAATAGSGGIGNLTVTNWLRDKGFGMGATVGAIPSAVGGHADRAVARRHGVPGNAAEPRPLARVAPLRPHRSDLGLGTVLFPRHVPEREPGHRGHPARDRSAGTRGGGVSGRVPEPDLAGLLVPDPVQRLLDPVQDATREHRHPGAHDHGRRSGCRARRRARRPASGRSTTGSSIVFSIWGVVRDSFGVAVPAVQDPREHGRHRADDCGRPDLPGEPALPAPGRAAPLWREAGLLACSAFYAFFAFFVVRWYLRDLRRNLSWTHRCFEDATPEIQAEGPRRGKRALGFTAVAAVPGSAWVMAQPAGNPLNRGLSNMEVASVSDAIEQRDGDRAYMSHEMRPLSVTKFAGPAVTVLLKKERAQGRVGRLAGHARRDGRLASAIGLRDGPRKRRRLRGHGGLMATAMKVPRASPARVIDASVRDTPARFAGCSSRCSAAAWPQSTTINHYRVVGVNVPVRGMHVDHKK